MTNLLQTLAATEETGGISALGIDPWAILAQAVTFLLLFFVIKRFALNGIIETLEKRRKTINQGVDLGLKMAEEKEKLDERIEKALKEARVEADKIIAAGHQDAEELIKQAEEKAAQKMQVMLSDAEARIGEEIELARKELEKELLVLVAAASEAVIGEKIDETKDAKLISRALEEARK